MYICIFGFLQTVQLNEKVAIEILNGTCIYYIRYYHLLWHLAFSVDLVPLQVIFGTLLDGSVRGVVLVLLVTVVCDVDESEFGVQSSWH